MMKRVMSQAAREKIRAGHLGQKHSEGTKAKISRALKKRVTPEIRKQMSIAAKKRMGNMSKEQKQAFVDRVHKTRPNPSPDPAYWAHRLKSIKLYLDWRELVLERDNSTCTLCGSKTNICVHHIKPIMEIIKENLPILQTGIFDVPELWDINNGVTRCTHCHMTIDHKRQPKKKKLKIILTAVLKEPIRKELKVIITNYLNKELKDLLTNHTNKA